jgi:exonuclease III
MIIPSTIDPNLGSNPHNLIYINPEEPLQDASLSNNGVKCCLLNARLRTVSQLKFTYFIICEHTPDLVAVTETWFTDKEFAVKTLSTLSSYKFFDEPCLNRQGGGTGLLFKENILVTKIAGGKRQSFEYSERKVKFASKRISVISINFAYQMSFCVF